MCILYCFGGIYGFFSLVLGLVTLFSTQNIYASFSKQGRLKNEAYMFLFFYLYLHDYFTDVPLADTGCMAVFREIDGKLSRVDFCVGSRTVDIKCNVFLFIVGS